MVVSSVFPDRRIIRLEQTISTNRAALELSDAERLPEGSVIVTDNQTGGRGQGDNRWESEPHRNLTFTIILYPRFVKGADQFMLSKAVSLAAYDFLSRAVEHVSVKWPNDVYVGDKKIVGILAENFIEGAYLNKSVIGMGMNINQEHFSDRAPGAVSLQQLTGKTYRLERCLDKLIECIENRYGMLKNRMIAELNEDYLRRMYRFGMMSKFGANGKTFNAVITGVNKYGMLEMTTLENEKKTFGFKEVTFNN